MALIQSTHLRLTRLDGSHPLLVFRTALFFVLASPFELSIGSGFSHLVRLGAGLLLLATVLRRWRPTAQFLSVIGVVTIYLAANLHLGEPRLLQNAAMIIVGAALGGVTAQGRESDMAAILTGYVVVHIVGFIVAFMAFYGTGVLLDLHGLIFPGSARIESLGVVARIAGFHVEPGTYSQWIMAAVLFRALIIGRLFTWLHFVAAITVVASLSLWGLLAACTFVVLSMGERLTLSSGGRWKLLVVVASILPVGLLAYASIEEAQWYVDIVDFLGAKASLATETGFDKQLAAEAIQRDLLELLILPGAIDPGFCTACRTPADAGVGLNFLYYFGAAVSTALFLSLGWKVASKRGVFYLGMLSILLVWKAPYYDLMLWAIVGYILSMREQRGMRVAVPITSWKSV